MSEFLGGAGVTAWVLAANWAFWFDGDAAPSRGFWILIAAGAILGGLAVLMDLMATKKPSTRRRRASHTK